MRLRGQVLKSFHHLLPLDRNTSLVVAQACSSSEPRPISDFVFRALMRFVPFFTLFKILLEQAEAPPQLTWCFGFFCEYSLSHSPCL